MNKSLLLALLSLLIFFLLIGCTSQNEGVPEHIRGIENLIKYSEDAESKYSIKLIRGATFEAPKKFSLKWYKDITDNSWLAGIEIDNSGRVFIADLRNLKIHLFNSEGKYLTSMGREGSGPGEYHTISDTEIVSNKLHVFDFIQYRTTIYPLDSLQGIEVVDVRPPANLEEFDEIRGWLRKPVLFRGDGTYLVGFVESWPDARFGSSGYNLNQDRPIKYYFMDKKSYIFSDEIFELQKDQEYLTAKVNDRFLFNRVPLPFIGRSLITISDNNHIYTAWTDDFLIKVYSPNGSYLRAFYHPFQKKPLKREEVTPLFAKDERNRELIQHAELPENWPVINSMLTDDENRLWVSTIVADDGVHEWWILEDTGELVVKFTWPDNHTIEAIKNGNIYSFETDKENGLQQLVKYKYKIF